MPILRDWHLEIDADMVLRGQGAAPDAIRKRSPVLIAAAEQAIAEGLPLLEPVVAYRQLKVESLRRERLALAGGASLTSPLIARRLGRAQQIVVAVCTIGEALEKHVSELFTSDPIYALALDGFGLAAVEALATAACDHWAAIAAAEGARTTVPLSPGLVGWPLEEGQRQIFALLDAGQAGVHLTSSSLMIPRKSISFVLGLGAAVADEGRTCDDCDKRETCRYRR